MPCRAQAWLVGEAWPQRWIGNAQRGRERCCILCRREETGSAMLNEFGDTINARRHDRRAACHCFYQDQREAFRARGKDEGAAALHQGEHSLARLGPDETYAMCKPFFRGQVRELLSIRPISRHKQIHAQTILGQKAERLDDQVDPLAMDGWPAVNK
jgi:hypothetical protein